MARWILALPLIGALFLTSASFAHDYVVREGDSLSQIAADHIGRPINTPDGSLSLLLALNPSLRRDIDRVLTGTRLHLPDSTPAHLTPPGPLPPAAEAPPSSLAVPEPAVPEEPPGPPPQQRYNADLFFHYFRIDQKEIAGGATSTLLSKLSPELRFTYRWDWSNQWTLALRGVLSHDMMSPDVSAAKREFQNSSLQRLGAFVGGARRWENGETFVWLGAVQRLFSHGVEGSANVITIDKVMTPEIKISHEQFLFNWGEARLGALAAGSYLMGASGPTYDTRSALEGEFDFFSQHEFDTFQLRATAYLRANKHDSSLVYQATTQIGFGLSYLRTLGNE